MAEYKAVIRDARLAEEIVSITSEYQDQMTALLERAKRVETTDDYKRLALSVGHVLATLGETVLFPIYRQHSSLTPEVLKAIIQKDAKPDGGENAR